MKTKVPHISVLSPLNSTRQTDMWALLSPMDAVAQATGDLYSTGGSVKPRVLSGVGPRLQVTVVSRDKSSFGWCLGKMDKQGKGVITHATTLGSCSPQSIVRIISSVLADNDGFKT